VFTSVIASNLHSSYQRRKQANLGANPDHPPIRSLSAAEVKKKREQWRETQKQHRAAEKRLRAVLDITPESSEEPSEEMLARPHPAVPIPWSDSPPAVIPRCQSPPAVIPPTQSPPAVIPPTGCARASEPLASSTPKQESKTLRLKNQNVALKRELFQLRKQLTQAQRRSENLRKGLQREKKKLQPKKKNMKKVNLKKKVTRREKVSAFLSRDENSRQLAGKKDTITRNKIKLQRRILCRTLKELHGVYNTEVAKEDSISYRQFLRLRPFHITEPKASDRNTLHTTREHGPPGGKTQAKGIAQNLKHLSTSSSYSV
jgi:hypothetical protein